VALPQEENSIYQKNALVYGEKGGRGSLSREERRGAAIFISVLKKRMRGGTFNCPQGAIHVEREGEREVFRQRENTLSQGRAASREGSVLLQSRRGKKSSRGGV